MPKFYLNKSEYIYYEEVGSKKSQEIILFFNGMQASLTSWYKQHEVFQKLNYKALFHDLKGQPLSIYLKSSYSFEKHIEDTKKLLDFLQYKKVHIISVSYGGVVALLFTLSHQNYVKSLSIIDSTSEISQISKIGLTRRKNLASKIKNVDDALALQNEVFNSFYSRKFSEQAINQFKDNQKKNIKEESIHFYKNLSFLYENIINNTNYTTQLNQIKVPLLLIHGSEDRLFTLNNANKIKKNIPHCEFFIIPECGHASFIEKPEILNTLLIGFIKKNS